MGSLTEPALVDGDEASAGPLADWAGRDHKPLAGGLYVVSTPIGNLDDITMRAVRVLRGVSAVYAEDTRTSGALLSHLGIRTPLVSLHQHNEAGRVNSVLQRLQQGEALALVSDAGTPLLSDPGGSLAAATASAGHPVFAVPGASALLAALVVSGLPAQSFTFAGFLPAAPGVRRRRLKELAAAAVAATLIVYVPPHKLAATLADAAAALGEERRCCVARELTKLHEEAWRGTLAAAATEFGQPGRARGEIVLLIAGEVEGQPVSAAEAAVQAVEAEMEAADAAASVQDLLLARLAAGMAPSAAAREVAEATGMRRRDVYAAAMALAQRRGGS